VINIFSSLKDSTKSIVFIVLVLLLAVGFSFIPHVNTFAYMMTPTIAVLIMMLIVTRDGYRKSGWKKLGLHKLGFKSWGFALIVPIIPLAVGFSVAYAPPSSLEVTLKASVGRYFRCLLSSYTSSRC